MRLRFSAQAKADLLDIHSWIVASRPAAAREVVSRIRQTATLLAGFPGIGRTGRVEGTREFGVTGLPYTIVYLEAERSLDIVTIIHQARDYP